MSTPTPGPWEVRHESADLEWAIVVAKGGRIVANVNAESGPDIPPLVSTKMPRDANARLIAAAPDLLAALENATAELQAIHRYYHSDCHEGCPTWQAIDQANEAINIATSDKKPSTPATEVTY